MLAVIVIGGGPAPIAAAPQGTPGPLSRTVSCIAPAAPGGGWDFTCRLSAKVLQEDRLISQRVVVENMPGGGGVLALAHAVTRRRGDPHALFVFSPSLMLVLASGRSQYTHRDVTPLASVTTDYGAVAVRRDSAINSLQTLVGMMRTTPDALVAAGGAAPGGSHHVMLVRLAAAAGVEPRRVRYVPFTSSGLAASSVVGGHASVLFTTVSEAALQVEAGNLRVLAVFADRRVGGFLQDVPTAAEVGYDVVFPIWRGFYAPPDLQGDAVRYWERVLTSMTRTRTWTQALSAGALQPYLVTGDRFRRLLDQEAAGYARLLSDLGIGR
jgi:putative tricarboxylic transport membrane protein